LYHVIETVASRNCQRIADNRAKEVTAIDTTDSAKTSRPQPSTRHPRSGSAAAAIAAVEEAIQQLGDGAGRPGALDEDATTSAELLEALARLRAVQNQLAAWEPLLIGAARTRGASWAAIAPAIGVASRQAAERRYLRLNPHTSDQTAMTGEQRVQAARDRRAGERAVTQWARTNAATLRGLAGQITALDGLNAPTQASVDRIHHALGDNDTAVLLTPLAEAGPHLQHSHPALAGQIAEISETTDQLRREQVIGTP
jgi:hypothetical protein